MSIIHSMGSRLRENMMAGRPTRMKTAGDYTGLSILPCGEHAAGTPNAVPAPWLQGKPLPSTLHLEICCFMKYMKATPKELSIRVQLVERFARILGRNDEGIKVSSLRPVGSCVTGLFLPTSDIDMVVTCKTHACLGNGLRSLYGTILRSGFASSVQDILQASVPLLRITDKSTGIDIDLTEADTHGVKATKAVQKWLKDDETQIMKTLIMVVKMFLSIRRCGTTYTGGINSYVLVWMVVAWVKLEWPKLTKSTAKDVSSLVDALENLSVSHTSSTTTVTNNVDFGQALKYFFKFYGYDFNYYTTAIRIEPQPAYVTKSYPHSRYYGCTQNYLLSIFDPADSSIDMGLKAYGIKHIQETFKETYKTLQNLETKNQKVDVISSKGILGSILGGNFQKFIQRRAEMNKQSTASCEA